MTRMTTARQLILNELEKVESHLSAIDIFNNLKGKLPSLNLSTVYRSLDYLVKNQLISVSDLGLGSPVYETIQPIHHHLICLNCKKIFNLEDKTVSQFFEKLKEDRNFIILTNHLILFGHCQQCQKVYNPEDRRSK